MRTPMTRRDWIINLGATLGVLLALDANAHAWSFAEAQLKYYEAGAYWDETKIDWYDCTVSFYGDVHGQRVDVVGRFYTAYAGYPQWKKDEGDALVANITAHMVQADGLLKGPYESFYALQRLNESYGALEDANLAIFGTPQDIDAGYNYAVQSLDKSWDCRGRCWQASETLNLVQVLCQDLDQLMAQ